jgi:integrase
MQAVTILQALDQARTYWEAKGPSSRMMSIRANACASVLGMRTKLDKLGPSEATKVLTHLHRTKGKGSVPVYYAAFKRAVEMAGGDTRGWPRAGSAPRKCREPLSEADLDALAGELVGYETCDLLELLRGTGLRVEREALNGEALRWDPSRKLLHVTGKGSHERVIPVERPEAVALLNSPERMSAVRRLGYGGHLKRWNLALSRLRVESLKPTPHAVRHYYATRAYAKSGHNLRVVQELLGHADINTTARYLGVNPDDMRLAVA